MLQLLIFTLLSTTVYADFEEQARFGANDLKKNLMKELTSALTKNGAIGAIAFCHENALPLTLKSSKLKLGRVSLKTRNPKNAPEAWMMPLLAEAAATSAKSPWAERVHTLEDGKKVFLTPLYVAPQCLTCHGSPVGELKDKLKELYPEDQATGYKAGEFRGFIWVKS